MSSRYTKEERERFREIFAPVTKKYRSTLRVARVIGAVLVVLFCAGLLWLEKYVDWIVGAFVVCWLIFFIRQFAYSKVIVCPACQGYLLTRKLGGYCPECGGSGLKPGDWINAPHCDRCGKSLRRGKSRLYRIRACTHCGLMLDEKCPFCFRTLPA